MFGRRLLRTTDESQGSGTRFRPEFRASGLSRVGLGGPQIGSCGVGFGGAAVVGRDSAGFPPRAVRGGGRPRAVGAGGCRRVGKERERLGCGWARVDDVSKRRRQGLVVCRATLPFEGPCACPGVTLAPTFAGAAAFAGLAACQSRTVRV